MRLANAKRMFAEGSDTNSESALDVFPIPGCEDQTVQVLALRLELHFFLSFVGPRTIQPLTVFSTQQWTRVISIP